MKAAQILLKAIKVLDFWFWVLPTASLRKVNVFFCVNCSWSQYPFYHLHADNR